MSKNDRLHGAELDEAFQSAHKKMKLFDIISWILLIISACVMLVITSRDMQEQYMTWFWAALIASIIGFVFVALQVKHRKKAKQLVSDNIIRNALQGAFELIEYAPQKHIGEYLYWETQPGFWKSNRGNDYIRAKYRGVEFMFSDVIFGRDKHTTFQGQWLIFSLSKEISPPIFISWWKIMEIKNVKSVQIKYRLQYDDEDNMRKSVQLLNRTYGNDFDFDLSRKFWTNKDSEHMARNILNSRFEEKITSAGGIGPKHMCFKGNRFHLAIYTFRDFFEPCKKVTDIPAARAMVQEDVDSLKNLVEAVIDWLLSNEHLFAEEHIISAEKSND